MRWWWLTRRSVTDIAYDPDPKSDAWHRWKGVKPAERTPHQTEEEMENLRKQAMKGHKCVFKQKGNEKYCEVGDFRHGYFVDPRLKPVYRK